MSRIIERLMAITFLVAFFGSIFLACYDSFTNDEIHKKTEKIEAVYWHERNQYSVAVKQGNKIKMVMLPSRHGIDLNIICDVASDESCWYEYNYKNNGYGGVTGFLNIHIRSIDDINTADWNHGKFGSGKTQRIQ